MSANGRQDYPRPQFERAQWLNLNGEWEFEFDDERAGNTNRWHQTKQVFSQRIPVPFAYQSKLSGIGVTDFHDVVWYRKKVTLPVDFTGKRTVLHFGAVDYLAWVWVNGELVKFHEGGHTPFHADITDALVDGENIIVVKAEDFSQDTTLPRGKQYWLEQSASIFYTRTTGIWQTVWMEAVAPVHLDKIKFTSNIDTNEIQIRTFIKGYQKGSHLHLQVNIFSRGEELSSEMYQIRSGEVTRTIKLHDFNDHGLGRWWSPESPHLYDVRFTLTLDGAPVDEVRSYFGMRKISVENGRLCLNNLPYYMKLVLDQGYFPEGNLTPPSDEAIRRDVELTKEMGFNGARKHQKIEDPRYLYWCDHLGLLVWGEMANAYDYSGEYVRRVTHEWQQAIDRDYNHPSIVVWVPINESWGVPNIQLDKAQQQHALTMYHLTKSLDSTRLVVSNDGWEMVKTDICSIHDYAWNQEVLADRYSSPHNAVSALPAGRRIFAEGFSYQGEPILVTEFGGISFKQSEQEGWGYSAAVSDEDFLARLKAVVAPMLNSPVVQGFCYTQLTDVEQEINGLLTYDRKPKVPLEQIKEINDGK